MTGIIQPDVNDAFLLQEEQNRQMIVAIKKARVEKRLSYQAIVDGCERNGDYVSLSTVRRVCTEGSETHRFRYDATLRPIARFVLGLDADISAAEAATEDGPASSELLRVVVGIKEDVIAELRKEITDGDETLAQVREDAAFRIHEKERAIQHLSDEIIDQKQTISELRAEIQHLRKGRVARMIAIVALVALWWVSMTAAVVYLATK